MSLQEMNTQLGQGGDALMEAKFDLFDEYATPEQSFESFCDDMCERFGQNWVNKFTL